MRIVSPKAINDPTLAWFREARFGMFIHFGLYSLLGRGEWVQYCENIPQEKYARLMRRFNPSLFNADEWIDVAEKAGCRYIALTAKHHDGFCLFDSALTDYKITNTPFKRDIVGEMAAACSRRGMRLCLYYSQPDWSHPNFVHRHGFFKDLQNPPSSQRPDWPAYLRYYQGQVLELCTRYGRIDGIWFDGSHKTEREWQGRKTYNLIKKHQPGAVVNDRARYGDIFTPERSLPDDLSGYMFEACQAVSSTNWGYDPKGAHFNLPSLLENLVRVISKGGNFLLNVGPMPDGRIPEEQSSRMAAVGKWLSVHGESVFRTEAGSIATGSSDIAATRKGDNIYLFLCRWPVEDRALVPGIRTQPSNAELLADRFPLKARATKEGLELTGLPMLGPDPALNVIKLRFDAAPGLVIEKPHLPKAKTIKLEPGVKTVLSVSDASVSGFAVKGGRLRITKHPGSKPENIVHDWMTENQRLTWSVEAPTPGKCMVSVQLSCAKPYAGASFAIKGAEGSALGVVKATDNKYHWQEVGVIPMPSGKSRLTLQPKKLACGYFFAHIAGIALRPLKAKQR